MQERFTMQKNGHFHFQSRFPSLPSKGEDDSKQIVVSAK